MKGYMGKLLRVDLTARRITEEALDPQLARDYIGGAGLGIRLAYDEIPPSIDPLGPEAKLLIMTGPVTGTALGSAGRFEVVFKNLLVMLNINPYWHKIVISLVLLAAITFDYARRHV